MFIDYLFLVYYFLSCVKQQELRMLPNVLQKIKRNSELKETRQFVMVVQDYRLTSSIFFSKYFRSLVWSSQNMCYNLHLFSSNHQPKQKMKQKSISLNREKGVGRWKRERLFENKSHFLSFYSNAFILIQRIHISLELPLRDKLFCRFAVVFEPQSNKSYTYNTNVLEFRKGSSINRVLDGRGSRIL